MTVNVTDVQVLDNPTAFLNPFQFEISFECLTALQDDLEWKVIYVGSAVDEKCDQVLDSVQVGPLQAGFMKFVFQVCTPFTDFPILFLTRNFLDFEFQVDPPDWGKIPAADLLEVTVVLLTCSYRSKEFIRVGYYVANEYTDPELKENPPAVPVIEKIQRHILADQPRVTKWQICWDDQPIAAAPSSDITVQQNTSATPTTPADTDATMMDEVLGQGDSMHSIADDHQQQQQAQQQYLTAMHQNQTLTPVVGI
eukprot:c3587_g1_i2.p1 GENE.c3587_g1_i2~~c3587_g1_i2.p1  ORF type:complete len:271 (-),score=65.12 c3587_g1_i2:174-932(-)